MMVSFVDCARKTVRWHHKLFFHLVDITLLNAYNYILVWSGKKPLPLIKFTHTVSYQLLEKYGEVTPKHPGCYSVQPVPDHHPNFQSKKNKNTKNLSCLQIQNEEKK